MIFKNCHTCIQFSVYPLCNVNVCCVLGFGYASGSAKRIGRCVWSGSASERSCKEWWRNPIDGSSSHFSSAATSPAFPPFTANFKWTFRYVPYQSLYSFRMQRFTFDTHVLFSLFSYSVLILFMYFKCDYFCMFSGTASCRAQHIRSSRRFRHRF